MPLNVFWTEFLNKRDEASPNDGPTEQNSPPSLSYEEQTQALRSACREILHSLGDSELTAFTRTKQLAPISFTHNAPSFESPLTPYAQQQLSATMDESFSKSVLAVCVCPGSSLYRCSCNPSENSANDWLLGRCGILDGSSPIPVARSIYSFVHVNLSRRVSSYHVFVKLVSAMFFKNRVPFRPIVSDSGLSVVLAASDKLEQAEILNLLQGKEIAIKLGIRTYCVSTEAPLGLRYHKPTSVYRTDWW